MARTQDDGQPGFGALLRRHRVALGLSQEQLAERAGLTAQAVSALERGHRRAPYRETVRDLACALKLNDSDAAALEASVSRGRHSAAKPTSARSAPSRDLASFANPVPDDGRPALPAPSSPLIGRDREAAISKPRFGAKNAAVPFVSWHYWLARGLLTEGREWLRRVLDVLPTRTQEPALCSGAALLALEQGDVEEADRLGQHAIGLARAVGNDDQ